MTAMFPIPVWQPGTLQPSTPVNDAFLRQEVLARGATSILSAPPASPADGQVHILGASPTGAWSTFAQHDVVLWRSGTWYRFAPFLGWLKQVGAEVRRFDGAAWVVVTGGSSATPVQDEGSTVVAAPTAINFVGAGVTATNVGGVATVTIPGGGGGGASYVPGSTPIIFSCMDPDLGAINVGSHTFSTGITAQPLASTNVVTRQPRGRVSAGSGTAVAAVIQTRPRVTMASPFEFTHVFSPDNNPMAASHRLFIGLSTRTTVGDENPSTLINMIGIGYDSADTEFQFMCNDASGAATKVALGASFPKPTTREQSLYRVVLNWNGTVLSWSFTDLGSGATASGSASSDLPVTSANLRMDSYIGAGGTSTSSGLTHVCSSLRSIFP